jgi:hypothetical protein
VVSDVSKAPKRHRYIPEDLNLKITFGIEAKEAKGWKAPPIPIKRRGLKRAHLLSLYPTRHRATVLRYREHFYVNPTAAVVVVVVVAATAANVFVFPFSLQTARKCGKTIINRLSNFNFPTGKCPYYSRRNVSYLDDLVVFQLIRCAFRIFSRFSKYASPHWPPSKAELDCSRQHIQFYLFFLKLPVTLSNQLFALLGFYAA